MDGELSVPGGGGGGGGGSSSGPRQERWPGEPHLCRGGGSGTETVGSVELVDGRLEAGGQTRPGQTPLSLWIIRCRWAGRSLGMSAIITASRRK